MQPYGHLVRSEYETKDESPVQLLAQDSAQVSNELFDDLVPLLVGALHLDRGNDLQPPNQL